MFAIAPGRLVKGENAYGEFRDALPALHAKGIQRAGEIWNGFSFGGIHPGNRQYGITNFRPRDVLGGGTAQFTKTYGSAGSWCTIFSYTVPEDEIHAFAGVAIPDPTLIFSQLRWEVEDRKFPIVNLEESHAWIDGRIIVFKQDEGKELVIPEEQPVLLKGFQERGTRNRTQRVVPIGFTLFKNKDLMITERETSG